MKKNKKLIVALSLVIVGALLFAGGATYYTTSIASKVFVPTNDPYDHKITRFYDAEMGVAVYLSYQGITAVKVKDVVK